MQNRFYASLKLKKWMCELCTFSQMWTYYLVSLFLDWTNSSPLHFTIFEGESAVAITLVA